MKKAVNWNDIDDEVYKRYWDQNVRQFWVDEEIPVSDDKNTWTSGKISDAHKDAYEKILAGLTLLDTIQGGDGMPNIAMKTENLHAKAVFTFMAMMEQMHAKSYSTIFSTLSTSERIDELFTWVEEQEFLQKKAEIIVSYYEKIGEEEDYYFTLCASVLLETFLFYSGFYLPVWFSSQGLLVNSGEIINLIIRDEEIHARFTGIVAQKEFANFDQNKQDIMKGRIISLLEELYVLEQEYTHLIYDDLDMYEEVMTYVKYNADQALDNLGFEPYFNIKETDVNPMVINGINTETKNHDFFSTKGNGYIKTTNVVAIDDDTFVF